MHSKQELGKIILFNIKRIVFSPLRVCKNAIINSIGDSDIDEHIVRLVLEEKEKEVKIVQKKKNPLEQGVKVKPKKKKKVIEYVTNDSVLGKLDAGTICLGGVELTENNANLYKLS